MVNRDKLIAQLELFKTNEGSVYYTQHHTRKYKNLNEAYKDCLETLKANINHNPAYFTINTDEELTTTAMINAINAYRIDKALKYTVFVVTFSTLESIDDQAKAIEDLPNFYQWGFE